MIERGGFCYIGKRGASANYIHVDNVVEGLIRCGSLSQKKNRIYNLSDYCALEDFVEVLASSLGCKTPQIRIPGIIATAIGKTFGCLPGFPLTLLRVQALSNRSTYSIDRIQKELGYDHVISMKDGLENLVRIYKDRR
jgi:nucleoside-diphosphate-sugar epimerase